MICRRGVDAKDAAECSREVAGILAKFADAGGKSDTDRSVCRAFQRIYLHAHAIKPDGRSRLQESQWACCECRGGDNAPSYNFGEMLLASGR